MTGPERRRRSWTLGLGCVAALALGLLITLPGTSDARVSVIERIECRPGEASEVPYVELVWMAREGARLDNRFQPELAKEVRGSKNAAGGGASYELTFDGELASSALRCPATALFEPRVKGRKLRLKASSADVASLLTEGRRSLVVFDTLVVREALSQAQNDGLEAAREVARGLEAIGIRTDLTRYLAADAAEAETVDTAAGPPPPSPSPPSPPSTAHPGGQITAAGQQVVAERVDGPGAPDPNGDSRARLEQARRLYEAESYAAASELLALLRDGAAGAVRAEALYYSGLVELTAGQADLALPWLEEAAAEGIERAGFYRGYALFELGRYDEAKRVLERFRASPDALELAPRADRLLAAIENRLAPPERTAAGGDDLGYLLGHSAYARPLRLAGFGDQPPVRLDSFRGRRVILHLWASWCAPCVAEMPSLLDFYNRYEDVLRSRGVELVTVSLDYTEEALERFVERHLATAPAGFRIYWDERWQLIEVLGTSTALPQTLVLDSSGTILDAVLGEQSWRQGSAWLGRLDRHLTAPAGSSSAGQPRSR